VLLELTATKGAQQATARAKVNDFGSYNASSAYTASTPTQMAQHVTSTFFGKPSTQIPGYPRAPGREAAATFTRCCFSSGLE